MLKSHYLQGFVHLRQYRISSINSLSPSFKRIGNRNGKKCKTSSTGVTGCQCSIFLFRIIWVWKVSSIILKPTEHEGCRFLNVYIYIYVYYQKKKYIYNIYLEIKHARKPKAKQDAIFSPEWKWWKTSIYEFQPAVFGGCSMLGWSAWSFSRRLEQIKHIPYMVV